MSEGAEGKNARVVRWKFSKDTLEGARILFDGYSSNEFLTLRGINQAKSSCHIFQLLKGTTIILAVRVILDLSTLSSTNLNFVPLKYGEL